jgi:hypothetical protein
MRRPLFGGACSRPAPKDISSSGPRTRDGRKRVNLRERRKKLFTILQHPEETETKYRTRVVCRVTAAEQTPIPSIVGEHAKDTRHAFLVSSRSNTKQGVASRPPQAGCFLQPRQPGGKRMCGSRRYSLCSNVSSHTRRQVGTRLTLGRTRFFRGARALPDGLPKTGGSPGRRRPRRVPLRER